MKILTAFCISIILCPFFTFAQTYDTTQYFGKMNYVFQNVNKTQITTGLLKDYGIEFLNLDNYKGTVLHDSNYVGLDEWRMLYTGLYSSQISSSNMLYLDTINRLINKYNYTSMPVTFAGLYYKYQKLRDDATTANLMYTNNDRLYDVAGRTQNPYLTDELFAIAPIRQALFTGSNSLMFRPELFLSNAGKTISAIAIDPNGGSNYQAVAFNTPFTATYNSVGFYNINIRITYTDATVKYGHTKVAVYQSAPQARYGTGSTPATNEPVVATKSYLGTLGNGDITIDLADNNTTGQIRKPLIVVEGFDPNSSFGYNGTDGLIPRLNRDINNFSLISLNQDLDDVNQYDLIFLNYQNGTDYIQRNAYLLERVIQIVNGRKTTWNGVRQQNVIIGMSMGGLVTKYALRDMELNGVPHETRLFISHDAPHWGANVPVGAQAAVQHLAPWQIINFGGNFPFIRWVDMFPQAVDALNLFNSPAAKQMLVQRYILNGQSLTADNATHNSFLNEINQMGWPINCRNIMLSNGACNGSKPFPDNSTIFTIDGARSMTYFGSLWRSLAFTIGGVTTLPAVATLNNPSINRWAMLWQYPLSLYSTKSSIGLDFKIRAVPASGTQEIYRGDVYSKKKLLGIINVTNYFIKCHVSSSAGMLPLDNAPGGLYDINEFGIQDNTIQQQLPAFFQGYVQATTLQPQFCFVPTVSSLDFVNPQQFLTSNICNTAICNTRTGIRDYFSPTQNQLHISYTQANTNWLMQRQDANANCVALCPANLPVNGGNIVCTATSNNYTIPNLPPGATVAWGASPQGIVTINSPNSPQTTLTKVNNGIATLTATVTSCNTTMAVTKQIAVGAPVIDFISFSNPNGNPWGWCSNMGGNEFNIHCSGTNAYFDYEIRSWPSMNLVSSGQSGSTGTVGYLSPGFYVFKARATGQCGIGNWYETEVDNYECTPGGEGNFRISASPNPTEGDLNVTIDKEKAEVKVLGKNEKVSVVLYDLNRTQAVKSWTFDDNQNQQKLNVRGLRPGQYILVVTKGKYRQSTQIIIK